MGYSVKQHKLTADGSAVDMIPSIFTGGHFSTQPAIAVMHFTYGASARSSAEWFRSKDNKGSSAHIVIDRDGRCIQCVDFKTIAWHAGKSRLGDLVGLNQFSFGIELANWGYLKRSGDGWSCHTGLRITDPFLAIHKNGNPDQIVSPIGWEPYPEVQFRAAAQVVRALVDQYGITRIVGHDDISPGRKWDPGPAFDMTRFKALVFGERSDDGDIRLKVAVEQGLNLRSGPGTEFPVIELLAVGTEVEPIEQQGKWLSASVIGSTGAPRLTGWVHINYLEEV